jgi:hypothetical protein
MRYVILRDDDTNALTPVDCLERLYRPFLERGLPVNLATIPNVRTDAVTTEGRPEGFLNGHRSEASRLPIGSHPTLVRYLRENPGYHVAQHGCDHSLNEFDSEHEEDIGQRLARGTQLLQEAGLAEPKTFVAPYDKLSRVSLRQVAKRFRVISTGWFELGRLPLGWWPAYAWKKILKRPHWRVGRTLLLTHPGCLLSYHRPYATMLVQVKRAISSQGLTVLVTHWWEYFASGAPDDSFIRILHDTADWLATQTDVKVIAFDDLARGIVVRR